MKYTFVKGRGDKNGLYRLKTRLWPRAKVNICRASKLYKGVQRWPLSRVWLHLWRSVNPFFRPVWKQCFFYSFPCGFLVLRIIKWRHVYPTLFYSISHHHQVEVFIQILKILTSVNECKTFCHFCQDRQFTDNFWLNYVRVQSQPDFHCLKLKARRRLSCWRKVHCSF